MTPEQVALYGGALWVGPVSLAGYALLVWWLHDGPFTEWGKRRAKRWEMTTEQLREQYARSRAARLYVEHRGDAPKDPASDGDPT